MHIHPGAEPHTEAEKTVVGFLEDWGPGAWPHMRDCYDRWMTDDMSWENTGSPATEGKQEAMRFLSTLDDTLEMKYCTAELFNIASRDNVVLTERVVRVHSADGTVLMEVPITGTFVVEDGRIARRGLQRRLPHQGTLSAAPALIRPGFPTSNGRTT